MKVVGYQCDGCGVMKQKSNHWVLVRVSRRSVRYISWSDAEARKPGLHLCGEGCAAKELSRRIELWH